MKKIVFVVGLFLLSLGALKAQKMALVDMEYILKKIPAYEIMNRQLEDQSKLWQKEVSDREAVAQRLYKKYQSDLVFLSAEQKKTREDEIVAKERETYELKRKYFGPEGELFKKREQMMKPIQDEVWKVLKDLAGQQGYQIIIDRSSAKIVYADPSIDVSSHVLTKLGVSK